MAEQPMVNNQQLEAEEQPMLIQPQPEAWRKIFTQETYFKIS